MRDYEFGLDDRVQIIANGKQGTVKALFTNAGGNQYSVQYVNDIGDVCERYFRPSEIAAL